MEGAWFSIMHSLNLIIPRPDEDQMEMKSKLSSPSPNSSQPNPNPSSSFLKNLFQSEDSDVEEGEDHAIKDPDLNISIKERNQLYPPLLLKDYGKPVYKHLSRSSWELLLNSRYFLEEIVRHLGLEVSIVTHLPIADEDDSIEDLDIKPKTTTHTPWTLDSSIPRSHPPPTQTTAKPQIHSKTKDSLPPMNPPAPLPTHSPNIKNRKTIQQRLQSATNIPYHSNNENRFRKNQH